MRLTIGAEKQSAGILAYHNQLWIGLHRMTFLCILWTCNHLVALSVCLLKLCLNVLNVSTAATVLVHGKYADRVYWFVFREWLVFQVYNYSITTITCPRVSIDATKESNNLPLQISLILCMYLNKKLLGEGCLFKMFNNFNILNWWKSYSVFL